MAASFSGLEKSRSEWRSGSATRSRDALARFFRIVPALAPLARKTVGALATTMGIGLDGDAAGRAVQARGEIILPDSAAADV